jgi:predicted transcriptional regulator
VRDVYVVDIDTPLDEVLVALADSHRGAALVVMKNDKLAGILTTSDVCRLLADLLQQRFPAPPEDDISA